MGWELLHGSEGAVRLAAVALGDRDETTARVRDAFTEAGVWITDVHFFSGVQTVLTFEGAPETIEPLGAALSRAGILFDEPSRKAIEKAALASGEIQGTLAVTFAHGDTDLRHEVPAVPG